MSIYIVSDGIWLPTRRVEVLAMRFSLLNLRRQEEGFTTISDRGRADGCEEMGRMLLVLLIRVCACARFLQNLSSLKE